jgi:hypothetical protein
MRNGWRRGSSRSNSTTSLRSDPVNSPAQTPKPRRTYAAGASSCRVSQGGWEGRDTSRYLGKELPKTSVLGTGFRGKCDHLVEVSGWGACPGDGRFRGEVMAQTVREKARIRQARDDGRSTEDDIARKRLGPRGQKGTPDTATMTEDSRLQTPSSLDPGHTA